VTFGAVPGTGMTINGAGTVIKITAPRLAAGTAAVLLHWADGRSVSVGVFTVLADPATSTATASLTARGGTVPTTSGELPNTGSNLAVIAWLGAALIGLGVLLTRQRRRAGQP